MGPGNVGTSIVFRSSPESSSSRVRVLRLGAAAVVGLLALLFINPPIAEAGTYRVRDCHIEHLAAPNWSQIDNNPGIAHSNTCWDPSGYLQVYATTNVGATGFGQWRFDVPSGASLVGLLAEAKLQERNGYRSTLYVDGGAGRVNIGTGVFNGSFNTYNWSGAGRTAAIAELYCTSGGCPDPNGSHTRIKNITVTLDDWSPPSFSSNPYGSLVSPGGKRGTHSVSWSASDAGAGIRRSDVQIDSATYASSNHSCNLTTGGASRQKMACQASVSPNFNVNTDTLSEGSHNVRGCALDFSDSSGHYRCTSQSSFRVDRTAPLPTVDEPLNGATTNDPTPAMSGSAGDATGDSSQVTARVYSGSLPAGGAVQTHSVTRLGTSWSKSADPLSDGTYTVQATQTDDVPNTGTSNAPTFTVDTTAPDLTLSSPEDGAVTNDTTPQLAGTAGTASGDKNQVAVDIFAGSSPGGTAEQTVTTSRDPVTGAYAVDATALSDGTYTALARQADQAGNERHSNTRTFTVDTAPPDTQIDSGPSGLVAGSGATFEFSAPSESGPTFKCSLDGAAPSACSSPKSYTGLADGEHTFEVSAIDQAGNEDGTPATRTFTTDATPPETVIDSGPQGLVTSADASLTYSSPDAGASFECKLDDGSFSSCPASGKDYTGLADGDHTFQVRAVDEAGNPDPSPAERSWTVDTLPPETTITMKPGLREEVNTASFAYTSSESGSTFKCSLTLDPNESTSAEPEPFEPCPATGKTYTGLENGYYTFRVRATDPAGLTDPTPEAYKWLVDVPSAGCDKPTATVYDGYASGNYVKLRAQRNDDGTTDVCYRFDAGNGIVTGGLIRVRDGDVATPPPVDDEKAELCTVNGGSPIPAIDGQVGDPNDPGPPPYTPFLVDTYVTAGEAWVCLQVGDFKRRLIVNVPGVNAPEVDRKDDLPTVVSPPPSPGPSGYPSSSCQEQPGGDKQELANGEIQEGHLRLSSRQTSSTAEICVRLEGPATFGGVLRLDTTGVPGLTPVIEPLDDTAPCDTTIARVGDVEVSRGPLGGDTTAICVSTPAAETGFKVGTEGQLIVPEPTFMPDPDVGLGL